MRKNRFKKKVENWWSPFFTDLFAQKARHMFFVFSRILSYKRTIEVGKRTKQFHKNLKTKVEKASKKGRNRVNFVGESQILHQFYIHKIPYFPGSIQLGVVACTCNVATYRLNLGTA